MNRTNLMILSGLVIGNLLGAMEAGASNYPPDYCYPRASVSSEGPALVAKVNSGCSDSRYVIGYKASGMFGSRRSVDAIVSIHCRTYNGYTMTSNPMAIRLEREWHGTGFMSGALGVSDSIFSFCHDGYPAAVSLAFSADGQWDSRHGANYFIDLGRENATYKSPNSSVNGLPLDIWDFIVDQMRR